MQIYKGNVLHSNSYYSACRCELTILDFSVRIESIASSSKVETPIESRSFCISKSLNSKF